MSEQEPEYVWAFPPEKRRGGRGWLIGALIAAAVVIALVALLLFLRPWEAAGPAPTPSPTRSSVQSTTPSASPGASDTPIPTTTGTTQPTPIPTASSPTPADPSLPVFQSKVEPLLDDAATGLSYAADASTQEGIQIIDQLRGDAGRLADAVAPSSIAKQWGAAVQEYGAALDRLRAAYEQDSSTADSLKSAQSALAKLNQLVGA